MRKQRLDIRRNNASKLIHGSDAGVTLVELMVASGLLAISLVIMIESVMGVARLNAQAKEKAMASSYVSSVFEVLRSMPPDEMVELNPTVMVSGGEGEEPMFHFEGLRNPSLSIELVADSDGVTTAMQSFPLSVESMDELPDPMEVRITLTALDGRNHQFKVSASTMIERE